MDAPIQALHNLGIVFDHLFSSDISEDCRKTIQANFAPQTVYEDITERDLSSVPHVDLYVFGAPCQPDSTLGKHMGERREF